MDGLSTSKTTAQNEVPWRCLNQEELWIFLGWQVERTQQEAQEDLHSYSNYVIMHFVSPLNSLLEFWFTPLLPELLTQLSFIIIRC